MTPYITMKFVSFGNGKRKKKKKNDDADDDDEEEEILKFNSTVQHQNKSNKLY